MSQTLNVETPRILRLRDVCQRTGLSRSGIYERQQNGGFPSSIKLGNGRAVGWVASEVDEWVLAQIRASRT